MCFVELALPEEGDIQVGLQRNIVSVILCFRGKRLAVGLLGLSMLHLMAKRIAKHKERALQPLGPVPPSHIHQLVRGSLCLVQFTYSFQEVGVLNECRHTNIHTALAHTTQQLHRLRQVKAGILPVTQALIGGTNPHLQIRTQFRVLHLVCQQISCANIQHLSRSDLLPGGGLAFCIAEQIHHEVAHLPRVGALPQGKVPFLGQAIVGDCQLNAQTSHGHSQCSRQTCGYPMPPEKLRE